MSFIVLCDQVMVVEDCTKGCVALNHIYLKESLGLQVLRTSLCFRACGLWY